MSLLPIAIPPGFTVIVQETESVKPGQVIARRNESNPREKIIPLAKILHISAKQATRILKKNPGDSIHEGEIIAAIAGFLSVTEVVSTISGTFLRFERDSGSLVVEVADHSQANASQAEGIVAPFAGSITAVGDLEVMLDTKDLGLVSRKGVGGSVSGQLFVLKEGKGENNTVDPSQITVSMIDNVLLGLTFMPETLVKASGMGVGGIIALKVPDEDIAFLEERRMVIPLLEVDEKTWVTLAKAASKKVYLDAAAKTVLIA